MGTTSREEKGGREAQRESSCSQKGEVVSNEFVRVSHSQINMGKQWEIPHHLQRHEIAFRVL